MPIICRATAIPSWRCSSRSIHTRSTSTCIPPRLKCVSAIPAWCAACSSGRGSRRARAMANAPRPPAAARPSPPSDRPRCRSVARRAAPAARGTGSAHRHGRPGRLGSPRRARGGPALAPAEAAQAAFDVGQPSADARVEVGAPAPELLDRPLGAARAQVHETYIVAQTRDGIVIVDQHAAHERIVYERLKAALARAGVARQILLIPEIVELDEADVERLVARADELARYGPALEAFGPGAVAVRETPSLLGEIDAQALVRDLSEHMAEWDEALPLERRLMHVAAPMAHHGR